MAFFPMALGAFINTFKKPATLMYPVKLRSFYAKTRGKLVISINDCIFCGICQKKCPTDALTVTKQKKGENQEPVGRNMWQVDRLKCISCNCCVEACPKKCLKLEMKYSDSILGKDKAVSIENYYGA